MNEQPTDLPAEMQTVVVNLEIRVWIQGAEVKGDAVCSHGAVKTCKVLRPGDEHIIRAVMRRRGLTEDWNDTDGRTKTEVLARMRQIEVSDADLEATFGPNWPLVIAVIRRAAILTPDEVQRISDARDAAWAAASAAWAAAWATARDAASAAWGAAWAAAAAPAGAAAGAAAGAVVVSDLVGRHDLTQDHIDIMMKPWIDVLGDNWADEVTP